VRGAALASTLVTLVALSACKRDENKGNVVIQPTGLGPAPSTTDEPPLPSAPKDPFAPAPTRAMPPADAGPPILTVAASAVPGAAPPPTEGSAGVLPARLPEPRPDPDAPVIDSARRQIASCFSRLPPQPAGTSPGSRTVVVTVTVVPTGRVTRAEVSGAPEPELAECAKHVGSGLVFSSAEAKGPDGSAAPSGSIADLRTFSIDVQMRLQR
jgi:hypothetical protein